MKYKFFITETLEREIEVEADCEDDARDMVDEMYRNTEIVLDYKDFTGMEISLVK